MSDEKLKGKVAEGLNADAILNNPLTQKALTNIRANLYRQFRKTKFKQQEERDEIWRKEQAVNWFESVFEKTVRDGEIARKTLLQRIKDKVT